jgi:hypothetical protein
MQHAISIYEVEKIPNYGGQTTRKKEKKDEIQTEG